VDVKSSLPDEPDALAQVLESGSRKPSILASWFAAALWKKILIAMVIGIAAGWFWPGVGDYVGWLGEIFIRLIRMVIVPLVLVTITSGVASLGSFRKLGSIGVRALAMFVGLSVVAACVGIALAVLLQPGRGANIGHAAPVTGLAGRPIGEQLLSIIPTNPISAAANGEMLAIIFFSIVVGAGIVCAGEATRPLKDLLAAATAVMFKIVTGVMEIAPLGVFALIATAVGKNGSLTYINVSLLAVAVVCGSLFQSLVVHGAVIRFLARLPVWRFLTGATDALLVAISTGSSSATLPVAIAVSERNFGISESIRSTVLPLGASIGRDGTAMYVSLLAVFAAQVFGVPLHAQDYVRIVLTASLVALGTAPVPSASLFMLAAVLSTIAIDDARTALIVGFILPFDSIFNMVRTVPNATSNLCVAVTAARLEGEMDVDRFRRPPER
jgi:Na+/H+-dicarboxylate symporter